VERKRERGFEMRRDSEENRKERNEKEIYILLRFILSNIC